MSRTPFLDEMAAIARRGPRFFVPGHKGNAAAIPAFGAALPYDLTEVDGAYDLTQPTGALDASEKNMAGVYGSGATLYSASGATSCIQAMLALFVGEKGRVLMARGAHVSAVRALAFLDAEPLWLPLHRGRPRPEDVAAALAKARQNGAPAKAVYLTSPDYYGRMADVAALAGVCREHGAALLVDNAHGAHLRFLPPGRHPMQQGADACADSAHKTLPCLTPAAMLHLKDAAQGQAARQALNLFCSTSPSYLVLQSLDAAAGLLRESPPDFAAAAARFATAAQAVREILEDSDDPLRLCLRPALAGGDGVSFAEALLQRSIAAEYADGERIVLMASPWNRNEDFARLAAVFGELAADPALFPFGLPSTGPDGGRPVPNGGDDAAETEPALPPVRCSIRRALFGARETLPAGDAAGRVCAGLHAPCPPGVPLVLPGEEITKDMARRLLAGGISHLDVLK